MTRYTGAEALQLVLDTSDKESRFSSEEERDYSDDDRLYFEEQLIQPWIEFRMSKYLFLLALVDKLFKT